MILNFGQIPAGSRRFVIDHGHPVAASQDSLGQMRSNETGTAGD
jgi:hypothetical protein